MDQNDQRDYAEEAANRQIDKDELDAHVAEPNYVEQLFLALERVNPNDSATELWSDIAIQQLANYLDANGYAHGLDEDLADVVTLYGMYDLLKFTNDNK